MFGNKMAYSLFITALGTGLFSSPLWAQDTYTQDTLQSSQAPSQQGQDTEGKPQSSQASSTDYVTGGIGDEERDALESVKNQYNVHITNAGKHGEFVDNAHIIIRDSSSKEMVNAEADPLFYAQLAPGTYTVEESYGGQVKTQKITVGHHKPIHISFIWLSDTTDHS